MLIICWDLSSWAGEVAQQVKALATKLGDQILVPQTHRRDPTPVSCPRASMPHSHTMKCLFLKEPSSKASHSFVLSSM